MIAKNIDNDIDNESVTCVIARVTCPALSDAIAAAGTQRRAYAHISARAHARARKRRREGAGRPLTNNGRSDTQSRPKCARRKVQFARYRSQRLRGASHLSHAICLTYCLELEMCASCRNILQYAAICCNILQYTAYCLEHVPRCVRQAV